MKSNDHENSHAGIIKKIDITDCRIGYMLGFSYIYFGNDSWHGLFEDLCG